MSDAFRASQGEIARLQEEALALATDHTRLAARVAKLEAALRDLLSAHHHSNGDEWVEAARAALTPEPR